MRWMEEDLKIKDIQKDLPEGYGLVKKEKKTYEFLKPNDTYLIKIKISYSGKEIKGINFTLPPEELEQVQKELDENEFKLVKGAVKGVNDGGAETELQGGQYLKGGIFDGYMALCIIPGNLLLNVILNDQKLQEWETTGPNTRVSTSD